MEYFLQFSANEDTTMSIEDLAPIRVQAPLSSAFRPNDSTCSLQLSDLEEIHFSERRSSNTQMANPGGMWQAVNKRSSVHEGERPAKRSKGSFVERDSSHTRDQRVPKQWTVAMNTNSRSFQSTQTARQR